MLLNCLTSASGHSLIEGMSFYSSIWYSSVLFCFFTLVFTVRSFWILSASLYYRWMILIPVKYTKSIKKNLNFLASNNKFTLTPQLYQPNTSAIFLQKSQISSGQSVWKPASEVRFPQTENATIMDKSQINFVCHQIPAVKMFRTLHRHSQNWIFEWNVFFLFFFFGYNPSYIQRQKKYIAVQEIFRTEYTVYLKLKYLSISARAQEGFCQGATNHLYRRKLLLFCFDTDLYVCVCVM